MVALRLRRLPVGSRRPTLLLTCDGHNHRAFHDAADEEPASPWQVDPLQTDADRALRAELVEGFNPQSLREEYVAMRAATRAILEV